MDSTLPPESPFESGPPAPQAGPFTVYFQTLKALLTRPTEFFRKLQIPTNPVFALVFALVTHWIGSVLEYLWTLGVAKSMHLETGRWREIFRKLTEEIDSTDRVEALSQIQEQAMHWMMGAGSVLIDPFKTLIKVLLQTLAIWIAVRIFVPRTGGITEETLSYRTALTVVCFSLAPSILAGVPLVGSVVATVFTVILMIIGAREVYRIGSGRSVLIVLFPQLVMIAALVFVLAALGVALFRLLIGFVGA